MDTQAPELTVEYQFQEYCKRVKLDRNRVSNIQWIETRRAFYGAWGQALVLLRDEVAEFSEDAGVEILQRQHDEVKAFWQQEVNRHFKM